MTEKIELMHSIYGKKDRCICWNCHFCHWKIAGKGENRHVEYIWCEVYGINKENTNDTAWKWKYPACGFYNVCHEAPKKQIYKLVKCDVKEQMCLF